MLSCVSCTTLALFFNVLFLKFEMICSHCKFLPPVSVVDQLNEIFRGDEHFSCPKSIERYLIQEISLAKVLSWINFI